MFCVPLIRPRRRKSFLAYAPVSFRCVFPDEISKQMVDVFGKHDNLHVRPPYIVHPHKRLWKTWRLVCPPTLISLLPASLITKLILDLAAAHVITALIHKCYLVKSSPLKHAITMTLWAFYSISDFDSLVLSTSYFITFKASTPGNPRRRWWRSIPRPGTRSQTVSLSGPPLNASPPHFHPSPQKFEAIDEESNVVRLVHITRVLSTLSWHSRSDHSRFTSIRSPRSTP